jgi:hypothetical protein
VSDFVGVNPENLRRLADRLHDLAGVLAKDGALVKSIMTDGCQSTLDYSILTVQSAQVGDDAHTLGKRADLALEMNRQVQARPAFLRPYQLPGGGGTIFPPGTSGPLGPNEARGDYIVMAFDDTAQTASAEGLADGTDLANAVKSPGDPRSKLIFQEVGQALADHNDDPAYMQTFYAAGGLTASLQLARVLSDNDGATATVDGSAFQGPNAFGSPLQPGPLFSADGGVAAKLAGIGQLAPASQHLMALYSQGLASASRMQGQGLITSLDADVFANPPGGDAWSAQMLFTYGPSSDQWDPQFLALINAQKAMAKAQASLADADRAYNALDSQMSSYDGWVSRLEHGQGLLGLFTGEHAQVPETDRKKIKDLIDSANGAVDKAGRDIVAMQAAIGVLIKVSKPDPAADLLANRIGGESRVRFEEDGPSGREFDVVSDDYVAQTKPTGFQVGQAFRRQAKATFEKAIETERTPYFHFEGEPESAVLKKLAEYSERYGVEPVIDIEPLLEDPPIE